MNAPDRCGMNAPRPYGRNTPTPYDMNAPGPYGRNAPRSHDMVAPTVFLLAAVLLSASCSSVPTQQGRIAAIDSLLQAEVTAENVAGAAIQVVRGDRVLHRGAYGYAQKYRYGKEPLDPPDAMTTQHLFDLASLTKVFATTFAVMLLVDDGVVDLDAPVRRYLPEVRAQGVTVRHLLTHTAGLAEWEPTYYHADTPTGVYDFIVELPLKFEIGEARHYSDLGFMLLGYLVERVSGRRLDAFVAERLYEPLGLKRTAFEPLEHGFAASEIAATSHGNPFERKMVYDDSFGCVCDEDPESWDGWRTYTLRGEVNDGNAFYAHGGVAGHAGLFSTLDDLQPLVNVLLEGSPLISSEVVTAFTTKDEFGNGVGWAMDPGIIQSRGAPEGTFGHTGFTGTSVVVMPELDLSIILLTNRQNVGVDETGRYYDLNPTRQKVTTAVLEHVLNP